MFNLQTPERIVQAAQLVRKGALFPMNWDQSQPSPPLYNRGAVRHTVMRRAGFGHHGDDVLDNLYTQQSSQWDALTHVGDFEHGFWGGVTNEWLLENRDTPKLGIEHWAQRGIAGRAVLLDLGRWYEAQGRPLAFDETFRIPVEDVEACRAAQGVAFEPGDVVLIRLGWISWYERQGMGVKQAMSQMTNLAFPGLACAEEMAAYWFDHHVAALCSDNPALEAWPAAQLRGPRRLPAPLDHRPLRDGDRRDVRAGPPGRRLRGGRGLRKLLRVGAAQREGGTGSPPQRAGDQIGQAGHRPKQPASGLARATDTLCATLAVEGEQSRRMPDTQIEVVQGDITVQDTEAIVNAANNHLWMGAGSAGAIVRAGGREIEDEAMRQGPIAVGESVVTGGGALLADHVIHAAAMGQDLLTSEENIRAATDSALRRAEEAATGLGLVPALGTGVGGFPTRPGGADHDRRRAAAFGRAALRPHRPLCALRRGRLHSIPGRRGGGGGERDIMSRKIETCTLELREGGEWSAVTTLSDAEWTRLRAGRLRRRSGAGDRRARRDRPPAVGSERAGPHLPAGQPRGRAAVRVPRLRRRPPAAPQRLDHPGISATPELLGAWTQELAASS